MNTNQPSNNKGASQAIKTPQPLSWDYVNKIAQSPAEYSKLPRSKQQEISTWIANNTNKR